MEKVLQEVRSGCIAFAAKILGDKWNPLIIRNLCDGTLRFSQLHHTLGINPRTLSARLDFLEESGILKRKVYAEIPPRVEYTLTKKGYDLIPILNAMADWGDTYHK